LMFFSVLAVLGIIVCKMLVPRPGHGSSMLVHGGEFRNTSASAYTACRIKWGAPGAEVDILDLASLSGYAYQPDRAAYEDQLKQSFGPGVEVVSFNHYDSFPRIVVTRFDSAQDSRQTLVVAIKGTSSVWDLFADASLYSTTVVLQISSIIGLDLLDLMPNTLIAKIISKMGLKSVSPMDTGLKKLDRMVQKLENRYLHADIVFTGHSLGGALAAVAGARHERPAVVFSAPGGHFIRYRLDHTTRESMYRNVLNIIPDTDPVPRTDRQDATVQRIMCFLPPSPEQRLGYEPRSPKNPIDCHMIGKTLCELWRACGDSKGRVFHYCQEQWQGLSGQYLSIRHDHR